MRTLLAIGFLTTWSCESTVFATQAGKHVIYHWDATAWATEGERLCGGTAAAADQLVVAVSTHYGWTLPERGPTIDYFWDRQLTSSACASLGASACANSESGPLVFTNEPFDTHELAHAAQGSRRSLPFIEEGLATRWKSGMIGFGSIFLTSATFHTENQLRGQLEMHFPQHGDQLDYQQAMTWLVALELAFGPAKVGEFIDRVDKQSSPDDVERALQQVFGISLAESAALAEELPEGAIDDPVCEFAGLPTWELKDGPSHLVHVDHGNAHCSDDDLISIMGQRATWLFALELPESLIHLHVEVALPEGAEYSRQLVTLATCNGKVEDEAMPFMVFDSRHAQTVLVGGYHVGALIGEITSDGSVELPHVSFEVQP
jgi:hypothetical protein